MDALIVTGEPRRIAMRNLPNVITVARLALVPVVGYYLASDAYRVALPLFLVVSLSDFADGYLARRHGITSTFGAWLDPVADKLNMLVATVLLAWQSLLPLWLAAAIVARDVVIVLGALAYRAALGHLEVTPTRLSKLNTVLEFGVLLLVMAAAAGWVQGGAWMQAIFALVLVTVVTSGGQYVWLWGRKALDERRRG
jgi:cardiolipin synthase